MAHFFLLILTFFAVHALDAGASWINVARVRQVQCATDTVGGWRMHYLQAGVIRALPTANEPDVIMFREKNLNGTEWRDSKARSLCLLLKKAMADEISLQVEIDPTGHLLDIRL